MINFIPNYQDDDFNFSALFDHYSQERTEQIDFGSYPFYRLKYFFLNRKALPSISLEIDETKMDNWNSFKNIFNRDDYFYLIAYHYFLNLKFYEFKDYFYKIEGRMRVENEENNTHKIVSFFTLLYDAINKEKENAQSILRHEYIVINNRFNYINRLTTLLFRDYYELENAIRIEKNHFAKYGLVIKEVYIEIFRNFFSNYVDYLSTENFEKLKNVVYPSKKEIQSFKFARRKNWKNIQDKDARKMIINDILKNLMRFGYLSYETTFEQLDDFFSNKRRELPKMVWLKSDYTSLFTFYKIMEENKIIESADNLHWKIIADYFRLGDAEIDFRELSTKKRSTKVQVNIELKEAFNFLLKVIVA